MGPSLAFGGDLGRPQTLVGDDHGRPARAGSIRPLLLASTSPQRRAILEQLGIPFEVVAPRYEEHDPPGIDPVAAVRAHAAGKARSVLDQAGGRPVLGVDTAVVLDGQAYGKPASERGAELMLAALAGHEHEVVSGLSLLAGGVDEIEHAVTRVRFRALSQRAVRAYVATGEWRGRAGGYAIQERGAALVEAIEGDYLNVVGLPAAVLVRLLERRFPGEFGL